MADNLTTCIVLKSGNLILLEPSGPVQDCNGTALPFTCLQIALRSLCLHSQQLTMCVAQVHRQICVLGLHVFISKVILYGKDFGKFNITQR
jgi:hypothetical protein